MFELKQDYWYTKKYFQHFLPISTLSKMYILDNLLHRYNYKKRRKKVPQIMHGLCKEKLIGVFSIDRKITQLLQREKDNLSLTVGKLKSFYII